MRRTTDRATAVAILATLLVVLVVARPAPAAALITSVITKLATGPGEKETIASDGGLVVYQYVDEDSVTGNIGVYDLATGEEMIITSDARNPDVSKGTIVYEKNHAIYGYDWATKTEFLVASPSSPDGELNQATIDGRTVVWSGWCDSYTQLGIQGVNLDTGDMFTVSTNGNAYAADIRNGWIVYCLLKPCAGPGGKTTYQGDIKGYRLATGATYTLCSERHDQRNPKIGATGKVVWDDERNAPGAMQWEHTHTDVYGCSVYDRDNVAVATGRGSQHEPSVDGNLITYRDSRVPGGYGVLGIDMLSGTRFGMAPATYGGGHVYYRSGLSDGTMAWTATIRAESGQAVTSVYVMQPAQIDVVEASDCYTNAAAASRSAFPDGADSVVIAGSGSWTDELSAASLAVTDTPFLLTARDSLPSATKTELRRLGATSATIVGPVGSVSAAVQAQIESILSDNVALNQQSPDSLARESGLLGLRPLAAETSVHIDRISGSRYAMANAIAAEVASRTGWDGTLVIASGTHAAEAMCMVPLVSARQVPFLLAPLTGLSSAQKSWIINAGVRRVVIVGGTGLVSAKVASQVTAIVGSANVRRLSGKDAYATAAAVASYCVSNYAFTWNGAGVANPSSFTNMLTGGRRKGRGGSIVLLTNGKHLSAATITALTAHRKAIRRASYLGGVRVLAKGVRSQVRTILR